MGVGRGGSKLADMAYITGEAREQVTMFPVTLDELIPADHLCRVMEAFVGRLRMPELGFVRSEPAETGRPGYDPRDLLKLYLYGYMNQLRSSRRLEAECQRNVEVMWLLGRLQPDYKSIAEFRRARMRQRATAEAMRLRRCVVERPFAELKYRIFGHPRFLLRGRSGAQTEISLATLAYNLKRMIRVRGGGSLRVALAS